MSLKSRLDNAMVSLIRKAFPIMNPGGMPPTDFVRSDESYGVYPDVQMGDFTKVYAAHTWVKAAIGVIMSAGYELDLKVYKKGRSKPRSHEEVGTEDTQEEISTEWIEVESGPLYDLIQHPNPWMSQHEGIVTGNQIGRAHV